METNATISRMILYMYKIYANKYIWWNLIVKVGSILLSRPEPSAEQIHLQLCNHWQSSHHSFVFHWKSASAEPGGFLPSPPHAPWCAPPYQLALCQFQSLFQLGFSLWSTCWVNGLCQDTIKLKKSIYLFTNKYKGAVQFSD